MKEAINISGVMVLAVFLSAIVTYDLTYAGTPYYCKDTGQICIGMRLSASEKTCYYQINGTEKGKLCASTWEIYNNTLDVSAYLNASIVVPNSIERETYMCSSDGCVRK